MKSLLLINLIVALILLFTSCKKDDATYRDIDQVTITNIESTYSVLNTDLLSIQPSISVNGAAVDESQYDFIWVYLGDATITKSASNADTIATNKNLQNAKMGYPSGKYEFLFKMIEKNSGIAYSKLFVITVSSEFKQGFLVLTEDEGSSRLDMVVHLKSTYTTAIDILGKTNSALKLTGSPYFLSRIVDPFEGSKVYIGTSEGTNNVALESFTYTPSMNIAYTFKTGNRTAANFKPTGMQEGFMNNTALYDKYNYYVSTFADGPFSTPINNMGDANTTFKASKWIVPYMTSSYYGNFILFDEDKQKFYNYRAGSLGCAELPTGALFDYHINKKLIYMGYSKNNTGEIFAVLKNNDNEKYFLARFTAGYRTTIGSQLSFDELNIPAIRGATAFAVSSVYGYLYFAVGNKLYCYDSGNKTFKEMKTYENKTITFLRIDLPEFPWIQQSEFEGKLFVGTNGLSPNSGEINVYNPMPLQGALEQTHHFQGLGKIVDVLRLY